MRIAFFDDRYFEVYGAQENVLLLAESAKARKHEVAFVTTWEGPLADEARSRGLKTIVIEAPERLRVFEKGAIRSGPFQAARAAADAVLFSRLIHKRLRTWNCELVVAAAVRPALMLLASRISPKLRTVLFAQNSTPFGVFAAAALPFIDVLAPISSGALTTFPSWSIRFARSQKLLASGRDLTHFAQKPTADSQGVLRIVSVGSLTERKGFHILLDAIARVREVHPVHLDVVGGPTAGVESKEYAEMLRERAEAEDLPVTFHGWQDEVVSFLHDASVFALASSHEGLPGVIIEAMACGLPVVTTDAGGCRDAVIEDETGYVVPVDDVEALADRLIGLCDSDRLAAMGQRARDRALGHYSTEAFGDRFESLLTELERA